MAWQDVYELIDRQTLAGQQVLNVYYYFNNDTLAGAADAQDLIDSYVGQILPSLRPIQTNDLLHVEIEARNLFNPTDRAVNAISLAGTSSETDYQNAFSAVGVSLVQDNGAIRNGSKRFAGIPDARVTDGIITEGIYIGLLTTLMEALSGTLEFGVISTWLPIVVKRILEAPGVYRLPENAGETVYGSITDAEWNPVVTSQTSRKIGRGV